MVDLRRRLGALEEQIAMRRSPLSEPITEERPPPDAGAEVWAAYYQRVIHEPLSPRLAAAYAKAKAEAARRPVSQLDAVRAYRAVMPAGTPAAFLANLDAEIARLAAGAHA